MLHISANYSTSPEQNKQLKGNFSILGASAGWILKKTRGSPVATSIFWAKVKLLSVYTLFPSSFRLTPGVGQDLWHTSLSLLFLLFNPLSFPLFSKLRSSARWTSVSSAPATSDQPSSPPLHSILLAVASRLMPGNLLLAVHLCVPPPPSSRWESHIYSFFSSLSHLSCSVLSL